MCNLIQLNIRKTKQYLQSGCVTDRDNFPKYLLKWETKLSNKPSEANVRMRHCTAQRFKNKTTNVFNYYRLSTHSAFFGWFLCNA